LVGEIGQRNLGLAHAYRKNVVLRVV